MYGINTKEILHKWVDETIDKASLPLMTKLLLRTEGHKLVREGRWRGDISDKWRE